MRRTRIRLLLLLLILGLAAAFRVPRLGVRPMHADESVQAARFRDLWQQGRYVYNPDEYHGPTLTYATLPVVALSGASEFEDTTAVTYRLVPALFGIALVALLFLFADTLGLAAVFMASVFAAISPAMVFHSRYYIHETLLTCFTLGAVACGWRYYVSRRILWCLLAGGFVGLMQATKETAAISYLAAACAGAMIWITPSAESRSRATPRPWSGRHLLAGGAVAVLVAIAFLSSFFTNWRGPIDGVLTYLPWLTRAGGDSPHVYEWSFYLHRLAWWQVEQGPIFSEGLILGLAVIGLVRAATLKQSSGPNDTVMLTRWLAGYTIAMTAIYCLIPYKTPWCLLQFWIGAILLAGIGAAAVLQGFPSQFTREPRRPDSGEAESKQKSSVARERLASKAWRLVRFISRGGLRCGVLVLLLAGAGHLAWQAYRAGFACPADPKNPYVFAQTSPDIRQLTDHLRGLANTSEKEWNLPVQVVWTDAYYWPLPWYLRRCENVELWRSMPDELDASILIAAAPYDKEITSRLGRDYIMTGYYELRPRVLMQLWVKFDLWEDYLRRIGRIE